MSKTATYKRNATERSPLEGNPGRKQKESTNIPQHQETNEKQELHDEDPNTDQCSDKIQNTLVETQQKKLKMIQTMAMNMTQTQYYKTY